MRTIFYNILAAAAADITYSRLPTAKFDGRLSARPCSNIEGGLPAMSLVIPAYEDDFQLLGRSIRSVSIQAPIKYNEAIYVLSTNTKVLKGEEDGKLLLNSSPKLGVAMQLIPNLKFYARSSINVMYPGNNRMFGCSLAAYDICSFFDVDDLMHPQRASALKSAFAFDPKLQVLWHRYSKTPYWLNLDQPFWKWIEATNITRSAKDDDQPAVECKNCPVTISNGLKYNVLVPSDKPGKYLVATWLLSYENWWKGLPLDDLRYGQVEPFEFRGPNQRYTWWIYRNYGGTHLPESLSMIHNGWQTVHKSALKLIAYPDIRSGEDSLFNWRVIRAGLFVNYLPWDLGLYTN